MVPHPRPYHRRAHGDRRDNGNQRRTLGYKKSEIQDVLALLGAEHDVGRLLLRRGRAILTNTDKLQAWEKGQISLPKKALATKPKALINLKQKNNSY